MTKGLPRSNARGKPQLATVRKIVLKPRAFAISVTATGAAIGFGTAVLGDFPEGNVQILGAVANLQFTATGTNAIATWAGNFSLGTAPTADLTLSGSEVDIIASTAIAAATARLSPMTRAAMGTQLIVDNTDGSLEINLNMLINAADITDSTTVPVTVTGEVYISYTILGDD